LFYSFFFFCCAIDAEQDEEQAMLRLVQRLVAIRSVNGQDGERAVVDCLLQEAGKLGLKGETFSVTEDRPNVVFSIGQGPPRFLFVAHLDTGMERRYILFDYQTQFWQRIRADQFLRVH